MAQQTATELTPHCDVKAGKHAGELGYCLAPGTAELCEQRAEAAANYKDCHVKLMSMRQQRDHADGRASEAGVVRDELQVRVELLAGQLARKDRELELAREQLSGKLSPFLRAGLVLGVGLATGATSAWVRGGEPDWLDGLVGVAGAGGAELTFELLRW